MILLVAGPELVASELDLLHALEHKAVRVDGPHVMAVVLVLLVYWLLVYEAGLLHIDEGSLGGIGNTAPGSSEVIPMGSKRFALQGTEHVFL
jgi:hypothetical protein